MEGFGLDLRLLISQIVNFLVILFILHRLLYHRLMGKMEERARRIREGVEHAEEAERLLAEAKMRAEEELERARRQAREIIEQGARMAEQQRQEILAATREEAHQIILRAQEQAQREIADAHVALRQQVADLAVEIVSRLIPQTVQEDVHHHLIEEFLSEVEKL